MINRASQKEYRISWVGAFFCLILFPGWLFLPQFGYAYHTANTKTTFTLQDLVEQSHGAIIQLNPYYIISDNIVIGDKDTLRIRSTDSIVLDCSKKPVRLTVEGNLEAAPGCSSIIIEQPIHSAAELDSYQRYPGIIYDDLGIRRRALPKIRSHSISRSTTLIKPCTADIVATIQGTVTDISTGQPIPARISIRKSDGQYICDTDCVGNPVNYVSLPGFWITNGTFTCGLSEGTTDITVSQGYEYIPYHETFEISSGELKISEISLTPIVSMNSVGWFAGDAHNHISHGEKTCQTNIPYTARIARGQGYDWFYAGDQWGTATTPLGYAMPSSLNIITQQLSTTDFLCLWNKEHPKDFLGHMNCPGITNWQTLHNNGNTSTTALVIYPHYELVKEIQDQGGIAIYTHPLRMFGAFTDSIYYPGECLTTNVAREMPLDVLITPESVPIVDFMTDSLNFNNPPTFWYILLNRGYRIGCAAFTDAAFDRIDCNIGHNMTYTYIPDSSKNPDGSLVASSILTSLRQGRTIGTSGPLILFNIDSAIPGDTLTINSTIYQAQIRAYCVNQLGYYLKQIDLIRNGLVLKSYTFSTTMQLQSFETSFNFSENTQAWYVVRVLGSNQINYQAQVAYTSPIYFALDSGYQTPLPVYAHVTGNIYDSGIPVPIDAQVDILNFGNMIQSFTAANGSFDVTVPATSKIRVSYGNITVTKSIFLDYKPLYDKIVRCGATEINNPQFYNDLISLLGNIPLHFQLPIELGDSRKNVFIVVIDGARYTETFGDNTANQDHGIIPHIWNDLRPLGSINTSFYNLGTTVTNPGHANIATGTWQYINNDGLQRPYNPTFFEYYRQQEGIDSTLTWLVTGKTKLNICSYSTTTAGYTGAPYRAMTSLHDVMDNQVFDNLTTIMNTYHPKLVLVNLASVDSSGHSGNWSSYTSAIHNADQIVYNLWSKITSDPYYQDKTDLIVTDDHGRHDDAHGGFRNHGCTCDGCRHVMFLALGPDFKSNYIDPKPRSQIDICPTIGWILGFYPSQSTGEPMQEALLFIPVELLDFEATPN
ncbi:MAG: CehA/McbA family metallohydrolase [bacterium]